VAIAPAELRISPWFAGGTRVRLVVRQTRAREKDVNEHGYDGESGVPDDGPKPRGVAKQPERSEPSTAAHVDPVMWDEV